MKKIFFLFLILFSRLTIAEQPKKLRWGILSTSEFSKDIVAAIKQSDRSEITAVASRSLKKAQDYAREQNIAKAYGSYDELLNDPSIDIIYNPLPNSLHGIWTVKAAKAGKHVLCEKPLVTALEDFEAIEQAAQQNNVIVSEAFAYLHHPQTTKLKELIASKKIGDIHSISCWLSINLPQRFQLKEDDPRHIRLRPELGGGALWDLGVYCSSLILHISDAFPEKVSTFSLIGKTGVDIKSACTMRLSNGILAQFTIDFYAPYQAGLRIIGSEGYITVDAPWHPVFFDNKDSCITVINSHGKEEYRFKGNLYLYEIQAMENSLLDHAPVIVPLSWSKNFLKTMLAVQSSCK